ncbi:hypothetical protein FRACA_910006 [Frankia canadensis]|uniref:Uncharacterized protein n=1 Tax=Frankia canadensis TaxID=1836972 RepID=A0A2I2L2E8_9ACTN|nr:hypothetical protein FRACA_910006 [Frankia canadensis]SOU59384.1 hypothetical protein FRACA_910006 [Frankia canadensis]
MQQVGGLMGTRVQTLGWLPSCYLL